MSTSKLERWTASSWRLPVASGLLLPLAHYGGLLLPNFVAFVPLLVWLDARTKATTRERVRGAVLFSLVCYGIGLEWIHAMLAISPLAALMYVALLVLFTIGAAVALPLLGWTRARTGWSWGFLLPVCWLPFEWLRTWGDLRMTVDHVAHGLAGFPFLIQFADLFGPYGVGAWLLAVNGLLCESVLQRKSPRGRRALVLLAVLVGAVLAYDAWRWTHPPAVVKKVRVHEEALFAELTRRAAREKPDLIFWPESGRPKPVRHVLSDPRTLTMPEVQKLAVETGADILTGVEYWRYETPQKREYYNAALVARRDGTVAPEWTAKQYLVPFTEGVPFRSLIGPLVEGKGGEFHWLSGGFTPGPTVPLPAAGLRVGVLVCYEEFYFDLSRRLRNEGADLQAVITNDAWFGRTVFQDLLSDVARMRAIETRSSIVRVANTGISGFVDPLGRFRGRTALFEEAVEVDDVEVTAGKTLYVRIGDVVAWAAIAGLLVAILAALSRRSSRTAATLAAALLLCVLPSAGCQSSAVATSRPGSSAAAPPPAAAAPALKIATWNIEWLTTRDSRGRRTPASYAALREYARALDADVIALQEVDGAEAATLVFDPGAYRFHFTHDADNVQRAGFAWKKELDVTPNADVKALAMNGRRPGADVTLRAAGRELRLLSIHLKSGCQERQLSDADEDCAILRRQLPALEAWIDDRAREAVPFAVLGDFNRAFGARDEFWPEIDDATPASSDLTDAGAGAKPACWNGRYQRFIDHIVLSRDAAGWLAPGSFRELVFEANGDPHGGLSDHCALSVVLGDGETRPGGARVDAPVRIGAREAAGHVGELATVCGTVASGRYMAEGSRITLLNLDAPHPNEPFTLVIKAADRERFGTPEVAWKGRRICVTGTIENYRGKPQIVARSREQVALDP